MENSDDFSQKLISSVEARMEWYNTNVIPKILDNYRLIHSCVKNLYDLMLKKSLAKPDPYRLDRKISDIKPPENEQFADIDRVNVISVRFSDYETMLDWICTYYKFSIEQFSLQEIKKFLDFNNAFQWTSLSPNNPSPNTRGLAEVITELRRNSDALTISTINDILAKCQKSIVELTTIFKDISEFAKEHYKCRIRKDIFQHPKFDSAKALTSPQEELTQIKKTFPVVFGKEPFYSQLVEELIKEDQAPNKDQLRENLLKKLEAPKQQTKKKAKVVDTHEMLMSAVQSLYAFSTPLETIHNRLTENNQLLLNSSNTGWAKFMAALRKAFNIEEKPVTYEIMVMEPTSKTQKKQKIDFHPFCSDIKKRVGYYNSFATKNSPGYKKFFEIEPAKVLEFLSKQITDIQNFSLIIKGFDTYFKNSTPAEVRPKVKGLSMELTSLKNNTINTNQYIADYVSYVEEQEQMKKLGIAEQ